MRGVAVRLAAVFAVVALVAAGCGDDDGGLAPSTVPATAAPGTPGGSSDGSGYSDGVRALFMEGCAAEGNDEFCECALDYLEGVMGEDEFIRLGIDAFEAGDQADLPPEVMDAASACVDRLGSDEVGEGFSEAVRNEFLAGCVPEAGLPFCECTIDALAETLSEAELIDMGMTALDDADDVPPEVMAAVLDCVDLVEVGQ